MQEVDIIGNIAESNIHFMLNTTLWNNFNSDILSIISHPQIWHEVKLLSANGERNSLIRDCSHKCCQEVNDMI